MRATNTKLLSTAIVILTCMLPLLAQGSAFYTSTEAPCADCHLCPAPTQESPCLKTCPGSVGHMSAVHRSDEGPAMILLGQSGDLYEPVMFDHRSHAEMGSMGDGCSACHHYTPAGRVPPCSECHTRPAKLGQPGLKGAYHRQCLGCHKQWSGSTECVECHTPNKPSLNASAVGSSEPMRLISTFASKPGKMVYNVPDQVGEKVTFYHNDHVDKFGVECVTCHQRESCGYCHDPGDSSVSMKSAEDIHAICNDCHDGDNCKLCHGKQEKSPFKHDASHWRLGEYHRHLPCRSCHEVGQRIESLRADCSDCHEDWGPDNFNHRLTGLELDETHQELDCTDCHSLGKYHQPPTCDDCHDDDHTPRATPPGVIISSLFENETNPKEVP